MKYAATLISLSILSFCTSVYAAGNPSEGRNKANACASCHGSNGISKIAQYPNLAGQKTAYLSKQLQNFRSGARQDPVMNAMAKPLSDADIENLAAWYSSLK